MNLSLGQYPQIDLSVDTRFENSVPRIFRQVVCTGAWSIAYGELCHKKSPTWISRDVPFCGLVTMADD